MKGLAAMMLFGGFTMGLSYGVTTPLFYSELAKRGVDFLANGFFILYACPFVLLQPQVALLLVHALGLLNTFVVGALFLGSASTSFTLLYLASSPHVFLVCGLVLRLLQGVGTALMLVASYALLPAVFPKYVGRMTAL